MAKVSDVRNRNAKGGKKMKNLFRKSMLAAAIMAALSFTAVAGSGFASEKADPGKQAYERCDSKGGHMWDRHGKSSAWKKTLTGEQKTELDRLHVSLKKDLAAVKAEIRLKKTEVMTLVASDKPDMEALSKLTDHIAGLEKEVMAAKYGHMIKVRSMLTPEQKAGFDAAVVKQGKHGRR
ncbi:MAG: hypothetical protein A2052_09475 [Deltaproteobacteria bacterium GWA2_54_12]|nr:MAG: hypothetical protein A2052_09475 [Deltaproteobacteria bacterium GWA2_54_12]